MVTAQSKLILAATAHLTQPKALQRPEGGNLCKSAKLYLLQPRSLRGWPLRQSLTRKYTSTSAFRPFVRTVITTTLLTPAHPMGFTGQDTFTAEFFGECACGLAGAMATAGANIALETAAPELIVATAWPIAVALRIAVVQYKAEVARCVEVHLPTLKAERVPAQLARMRLVAAQLAAAPRAVTVVAMPVAAEDLTAAVVDIDSRGTVVTNAQVAKQWGSTASLFCNLFQVLITQISAQLSALDQR